MQDTILVTVVEGTGAHDPSLFGVCIMLISYGRYDTIQLLQAVSYMGYIMYYIVHHPSWSVCRLHTDRELLVTSIASQHSMCDVHSRHREASLG